MIAFLPKICFPTRFITLAACLWNLKIEKLVLNVQFLCSSTNVIRNFWFDQKNWVTQDFQKSPIEFIVIIQLYRHHPNKYLIYLLCIICKHIRIRFYAWFHLCSKSLPFCAPSYQVSRSHTAFYILKNVIMTMMTASYILEIIVVTARIFIIWKECWYLDNCIWYS